MSVRLNIKIALFALASALAAPLAAVPAAAADWGLRDRFYERPVVRRPATATRIVYSYRPAPVVRRVVVIERPYYERAYRPRWSRYPAYRVGWPHRRWHDR